MMLNSVVVRVCFEVKSVSGLNCRQIDQTWWNYLSSTSHQLRDHVSRALREYAYVRARMRAKKIPDPRLRATQETKVLTT